MSVIEVIVCDCCRDELHRSPPAIAALDARRPYVRDEASVAVNGREFEVTVVIERTRPEGGTEVALHLCPACRRKIVESFLHGYGVALAAGGAADETEREAGEMAS